MFGRTERPGCTPCEPVRTLVRANRPALGDRAGPPCRLTAESKRLFDAHVQDVVLTILPRLDVRLFSHDQGPEVLAVEHHDVGRAGLGSGCSCQRSDQLASLGLVRGRREYILSFVVDNRSRSGVMSI